MTTTPRLNKSLAELRQRKEKEQAKKIRRRKVLLALAVVSVTLVSSVIFLDHASFLPKRVTELFNMVTEDSVTVTELFGKVTELFPWSQNFSVTYPEKTTQVTELLVVTEEGHRTFVEVTEKVTERVTEVTESVTEGHRTPILLIVSTGIDGGYLHIREMPTKSAGVVTVAPERAALPFLACSGDWVKVRYKTYIGYAYTKYVKNSPCK